MIIRKKREWLGFIACIFASGVFGIFADKIIDSYILYVVGMGYISLEAIKAISTYDITKFNYKHTSLVIYICGGLGGLIIGGIAYYVIRNKELKHK